MIPLNVAGRVWDSDVAYSFRNAPVAITAAVVAFVLIFSAVFARWVAPHNPFDLATLNLLDASLPPMWEENGNPNFWLGTDDQGRDIFSAILFGMQVSLAIMARHVQHNVMGPVLVLATVHIATAIITEATLSFLGVGVPPTTPSLGTLIRIGNEFLFSGEWWITIFPGLALILLVLSVNLLGDWLRDALNPKLR